MAEEHDSPATEPQDAPGGPSASMIVTAEGLSTALKTAAPGSTIQLEKNTEYVVDEPLLVPDGVTLKGKGEMQFDEGLPDQFRPGTATTITANDNLAGNLLTLGNGSSVQRLVLKGATPPQEDDAGDVPETYAGRFWNVVAVASRRKNETVSAAIKECELINKNDAGGVPAGPTGGAILAHTHNPEGDSAATRGCGGHCRGDRVNYSRSQRRKGRLRNELCVGRQGHHQAEMEQGWRPLGRHRRPGTTGHGRRRDDHNRLTRESLPAIRGK